MAISKYMNSAQTLLSIFQQGGLASFQAAMSCGTSLQCMWIISDQIIGLHHNIVAMKLIILTIFPKNIKVASPHSMAYITPIFTLNHYKCRPLRIQLARQVPVSNNNPAEANSPCMILLLIFCHHSVL